MFSNLSTFGIVLYSSMAVGMLFVFAALSLGLYRLFCAIRLPRADGGAKAGTSERELKKRREQEKRRKEDKKLSEAGVNASLRSAAVQAGLVYADKPRKNDRGVLETPTTVFRLEKADHGYYLTVDAKVAPALIHSFLSNINSALNLSGNMELNDVRGAGPGRWHLFWSDPAKKEAVLEWRRICEKAKLVHHEKDPLTGVDSPIYPEFVEMGSGGERRILIEKGNGVFNVEDLRKGLAVLDSFFRERLKTPKPVWAKEVGGPSIFEIIFARPKKHVFPTSITKEGVKLVNMDEKALEAVIDSVRKRSTESEVMFLGEVVDERWTGETQVYSQIHSNPHFVVVGQSGSGKTRSVLSFVYTFARCHPDTIWYFADGKNGGDFLSIAKYLSPMPVAYNDESGSSPLIQFENVLDAVWGHYTSRQKLFQDVGKKLGRGISNILEYRAATKEKLPRVFFVIDEFSVFELTIQTEKNFKEKNSPAQRLKRLVAEARSYGVHLMFASQRYQATDIPVVLRSNLTNKLTHAVQLTDANFLQCPEAAEGLASGEFYLTSEGFRDPVSGISNVKTRLPFIAEDLTKLLKIHFKEQEHKPWDMNFTTSFADEPSKASPGEIMQAFLFGVCRPEGFEVETLCKSLEDAPYKPICARIKRGEEVYNIAFDLDPADDLLTPGDADIVIAGAKWKAKELDERASAMGVPWIPALSALSAVKAVMADEKCVFERIVEKYRPAPPAPAEEKPAKGKGKTAKEEPQPAAPSTSPADGSAPVAPEAPATAAKEAPAATPAQEDAPKTAPKKAPSKGSLPPSWCAAIEEFAAKDVNINPSEARDGAYRVDLSVLPEDPAEAAKAVDEAYPRSVRDAKIEVVIPAGHEARGAAVLRFISAARSAAPLKKGWRALDGIPVDEALWAALRTARAPKWLEELEKA